MLAILALAIVTPSYFFFSNQQDKLSEASPKKQVINVEEKTLDKGAFEGKTEESIEKRENDQGNQQENKISLEEIESLLVDVFRVDELGI